MGLLDQQAQARPPEYHCIIPDAAGQAILLVPDQGRWALPKVSPFTGPREFLPDDVGAIGQAASAMLGARLTVMRHLLDAGPLQVCELEVVSGKVQLPQGAGWGTWQDMQRISFSGPKPLREALVRWWRQQTDLMPDEGAVERPMWEQPGWFAATERWMRSEALKRGAEVAGPVEQVKGGWCVSTVLRLPTSKGRIYYKESWTKPPAEGRIIAQLASRWPDRVPVVLAGTPDGFGVLMRDFGPDLLTSAPDDLWPLAVRQFAQMQLAESTNMPRWRALGCADMRPRHLPAHLGKILDDHAVVRTGPQALAAHELSTLKDNLPRIAAMCETLERLPVPASFHHEDFRAGNIATIRPRVDAPAGATPAAEPPAATAPAEPRFIYFDWAWTAVSHPFFSLAYFLTRGLPRFDMPVYDWRIHHDDQKRKRICEAYLEAWTACAPMPRLWEALLLARQLNTVYRVVATYLSLPRIEPQSPWWDASAPVVPRFLRYILYQLALLDQLGPLASSPYYVPA